MSGMQWRWEKNNSKIKKIYTDWANHYLEKSRSKRVITDLQTDISDGVLLADVVLAVTGQQVQGIKTKPKNSTQMSENIQVSLTRLEEIGVNVEGLNADDVKDGNLKAILGLFFSLSRYKQEHKALNGNNAGAGKQSPAKRATTSKQQATPSNNNGSEMLSRLPSKLSSTKCPTVTNPNSPDKAHNNNTATPSPAPTAAASSKPPSRSGSPSSIPTVSRISRVPSSTSRLKSPVASSGQNRLSTSSSSSSSVPARQTATPPNGISMLDKFKFFSKDKQKGSAKRRSGQDATSNRIAVAGTGQRLAVEPEVVSVPRGKALAPGAASPSSFKPEAASTPRAPDDQRRAGTQVATVGSPRASVNGRRSSGGRKQASPPPRRGSKLTSISSESPQSKSPQLTPASARIPSKQQQSTSPLSAIPPPNSSIPKPGAGGTVPSGGASVNLMRKSSSRELDSRIRTPTSAQRAAISKSRTSQSATSSAASTPTSSRSTRSSSAGVSRLDRMHASAVAKPPASPRTEQDPATASYPETKRQAPPSPAPPERSTSVNRELIEHPTDHISSLRKQANSAAAAHTSPSSPRHQSPAREISEEDDQVMDVKPMAPLQRMPYLRNSNGPLPRPSFHVPNALSSVGSASSRLGVNRSLLDAARLRPDGADGYVSDGEILRPLGRDDLSGYMSEGGASMYPRKIQERIKEGMQAVKDSMENSGGVMDDDSFDDDSSVGSSGAVDGLREVGVEERLKATRESPYVSSLRRYADQRAHLLNPRHGSGDPWQRRYQITEEGPQQHQKVTAGVVSEMRPVRQDGADFSKSLPYSKPGSAQSRGSCTTKTSSCSQTSSEKDYLMMSQNVIGPATNGGAGMAGEELVRSNTLGRRKPSEPILFSRKDQIGTVISNPHTAPRARTSSTGAATSPVGNGGGPYVALSVGSNPASPCSHSWSTRGSQQQAPHGNGLSEAESLESLSSVSSSVQAQIASARASARASRDILEHEKQTKQLLRLAQNDKITFNAKLSPGSPVNGSALPLSGLGFVQPLAKHDSNDEVHGSSLSLISSTSSVYSTAEERHNAEVRKLKKELEGAQEKVNALTTQLHMNSHVVSAFEQSLSSMTNRLQSLHCSAEAKDSELIELRQTIDNLKSQSSGLNFSLPEGFSNSGDRRLSNSSQRRTLTNGCNGVDTSISRQISSDSVSSLNSMSSACSLTSQQSAAATAAGNDDKLKKGNLKKNDNWLRKSFNKVKDISRGSNSGSTTGKKKGLQEAHSPVLPPSQHMSVPNSPLMQSAQPLHAQQMLSQSTDTLGVTTAATEEPAICQFKKELQKKEMEVTECRLQALSAAHRVEQLRDEMNRMRNEMVSLKADNARLQHIVKTGGIEETAKLPDPPKRLSLEDPAELDLIMNEQPGSDGLIVKLRVQLDDEQEIFMGTLFVGQKIRWESLDELVQRSFKDHIYKLDPQTHLGLDSDAIHTYRLADVTRPKSMCREKPDMLPCGYLVGENQLLTLRLKDHNDNSVDRLAFDTLIPKNTVKRYISVLIEHRRIIFCGPSGTGKTYLAKKLANFLVRKADRRLTADAIATFNVDHKSNKELRQYLSSIAEKCTEHSGESLPCVIILDNLHHVSSLGEVFNGFLDVKYPNCPYIIGTMNQSTCSTTNLQLHHNFRWVLCANHMEPVKGFLGRYLRRKLIEHETEQPVPRCAKLGKVVDWMPRVWQHINKFLETHSSSDVTIGPRLFLSCPMSVQGSQVWFTDLWNYSLVPYIMEAVREGLATYGRRAAWEDPAEWVVRNLPWPIELSTAASSGEWPSLLRLRPEDVGYDLQNLSTSGPASNPTSSPKAVHQADTNKKEDPNPLMTMLMRLQEAAYSSPTSNDSDTTSLDSHSSQTEATLLTPESVSSS